MRESETPALEEPELRESFSMTDEEGDLPAFQSYLGSLSSDALWDVWAHLDKEKYPRRCEAAKREIIRRRLFFVSPYTTFERHLRTLAFTCIAFAVLAALVNAWPALSLLTAQMVRAFGGSEAVVASGGPRLVVTGELSPGEARFITAVLPPLRGITLGAFAALTGITLWMTRSFFRRRLHRDVFLTLLFAAGCTGLLCWLANA